MATLAFLVVILVAAGLTAGWRQLVGAWNADRRVRYRTALLTARLDGKRIAVEERKLAVLEAQERRANDRGDGADAVLPADLLERIQSWEDEWAKEAEEVNIRQLYAATHDWDKVRQRLPGYTARTDDHSREMFS